MPSKDIFPVRFASGLERNKVSTANLTFFTNKNTETLKNRMDEMFSSFDCEHSVYVKNKTGYGSILFPYDDANEIITRYNEIVEHYEFTDASLSYIKNECHAKLINSYEHLIIGSDRVDYSKFNYCSELYSHMTEDDFDVILQNLMKTGFQNEDHTKNKYFIVNKFKSALVVQIQLFCESKSDLSMIKLKYPFIDCLKLMYLPYDKEIPLVYVK